MGNNAKYYNKNVGNLQLLKEGVIVENVVFNVYERNEEGKKVRRNGEIPCVLYGRHIKNTLPIKITKRDMYRLLTLAKSTIVSLNLNGHTESCVVKELQTDPYGKVIHIDFQNIDKKDKIKMKMPVTFEGEGVLEGRQLLLEVIVPEVEVYGEADKLPESIQYQVGSLNYGDKILAKDLLLPKEIKLDLDENVIVATVAGNVAVEDDEEKDTAVED